MSTKPSDTADRIALQRSRQSRTIAKSEILQDYIEPTDWINPLKEVRQ